MTRIPADLQALLDQFEPMVREAFLRSIADITSQAQMALVIDAIKSGDAARLYAVLNISPEFFLPLDQAITQAYITGGIRATAGLPVIPDPAGPGKS